MVMFVYKSLQIVVFSFWHILRSSLNVY